MDIIALLVAELENEATTTRKMLSLVPEDKFDWAPHQKSMKMQNLATHIAELPGWVSMALTTDEMDFSKNAYKPADVRSTSEISDTFEKSYAQGKADLEKASEEDLKGKWILRNGEQILADMTKYETIRHAYSQTIHHRAQLGVYLRLLNIPIPGSYGPSADDQSF